MLEGSIEVPQKAAARLRNLLQGLQTVQQACDISMAMLRDALNIPAGWVLTEQDGRMIFTSITDAGIQEPKE